MNKCHSFRGSFVCEAFLQVEILPGHCDCFPTTRVLVHSTYRMIQTAFTRHFVCLSLSSRNAAYERSYSRSEKQTNKQTNTADIPITFNYIRRERPSFQYLYIRAVTTTWQASIIFFQYTRRVTAD